MPSVPYVARGGSLATLWIARNVATGFVRSVPPTGVSGHMAMSVETVGDKWSKYPYWH